MGEGPQLHSKRYSDRRSTRSTGSFGGAQGTETPSLRGKAHRLKTINLTFSIAFSLIVAEVYVNPDLYRYF